MSTPQAEPAPSFIVRGGATDEEIAAVTGALSVLSFQQRPSDANPKPRPLWNSPGRQIRSRTFAGPSAWQASSLPR
ncbi:MAG: acyl-CoA carboxylase subunit epsilon [Actinomycetes bacterium]|nr:acyl-CoA carboxylase subunit epsilon [Candidatus Nanopelagicales bacterium]MDP4825798.1 acyl-CoA carboxylase subunit epsilon [Candidatus Nanopelagicales bacterium]MDP4887363.1 acyl-CoA carboxylase subunit epsilon [Candidatus Nanopelagicales bacterium]